MHKYNRHTYTSINLYQLINRKNVMLTCIRSNKTCISITNLTFSFLLSQPHSFIIHHTLDNVLNPTTMIVQTHSAFNFFLREIDGDFPPKLFLTISAFLRDFIPLLNQGINTSNVLIPTLKERGRSYNNSIFRVINLNILYGITVHARKTWMKDISCTDLKILWRI